MRRSIQVIHLWSKGMKQYLGNIMLTHPTPYMTEEELNELVNTHPNKNQVAYCTFE